MKQEDAIHNGSKGGKDKIANVPKTTLRESHHQMVTQIVSLLHCKKTGRVFSSKYGSLLYSRYDVLSQMSWTEVHRYRSRESQHIITRYSFM
jgi:hypothetical protein